MLELLKSTHTFHIGRESYSQHDLFVFPRPVYMQIPTAIITNLPPILGDGVSYEPGKTQRKQSNKKSFEQDVAQWDLRERSRSFLQY